MHDQEIRSLCECGKSWIGPILIGTEYDRLALRLHPIRQSGKISMRYPQSRHLDAVAIEDRCGLGFGHIDIAGIEPNDSRIRRARRHDGTENLKGAVLAVEQAAEERGKARRRGIARRSDDR